MTSVEPLDNHPDDPNNWSCFGHVMSSIEYLKKHNIWYATDCRKCPLQEKCITRYNDRVYNNWVEEYYLMSEEDFESEIELCDYTGDQCFGNKLFCEDCPVMHELNHSCKESTKNDE